MGRITKIVYREIDSSDYSIHKAGEFYFHHNLLKESDMFHKPHEDNESDQIMMRSKIAGSLKKSGIDIKVNSSILGISSLKNKMVFVSDLK